MLEMPLCSQYSFLKCIFFIFLLQIADLPVVIGFWFLKLEMAISASVFTFCATVYAAVSGS